MKKIIVKSVKHGTHEIFVDDEDFEKVSKHNWFLRKGIRDTTYYARTCISTGAGEARITVLLHRLIMGCSHKDGKIVDHRNHNGLDCQKANLRVCTHDESVCNRRSRKNSTSKYLGVTKKVDVIKGHTYTYWVAQIRVNKKGIWLGQFPYTPEGEIAAAKVYNEAALKYHGEFACLNVI